MREFIAFVLVLELTAIFGVDFFGWDFSISVVIVTTGILFVLALFLFFATPEQNADLNKPMSFIDKVFWFVIIVALSIAFVRYVKVGYFFQKIFAFLFSVFVNLAYFVVGLILLVVFLGVLYLVENSSSVSKANNNFDYFSMHRHSYTDYGDDDDDDDSDSD